MLLTALGLSEDADVLYRVLLNHPGCGTPELTDLLDWPEHRVQDGLDNLADLSLVYSGSAGAFRVISPRTAYETLASRIEAEMARRRMELADSKAAVDKVIAEYLAVRTGPDSNDMVERLYGVESVRRRIAELADSAQRETASFAPGGAQPPDNRAASRPVAEALVARGIKARTVYLDSIHNDSDSVQHAEWHVAQGNQIRTVPSLPLRMHIVDSAVALVPLDPEHSHKGAALLREPGAVAAFCALFEAVWCTALVFGEPPRLGLTDPGSRHRELLRLLGQGCTDEAAARRLGVSLRTERRLISELMRMLDARSRFQLGQRAIERGLL